jgi:hypothetical protein
VILTIDWPPAGLACPSSEPERHCGTTLQGPVVRAGGQYAQRRVGSGADCTTPGAARSVSFTGYTPPPDAHSYNVTACMRGPGVKKMLRQVDALLRSLRFS